MGQLIAQNREDKTLSAGRKELRVQLPEDLPTGIYYFNLLKNEEIRQFKLFKY
jgi:hypothetical protein